VSVNSKDGLGISSLHRHPGWQRQRLGANVGLADGSVLFLPTSTAETKIRLFSRLSGVNRSNGITMAGFSFEGRAGKRPDTAFAL